MKECLIVVGLFFSVIVLFVSLDFFATWNRYPRSSCCDVARLVARSYP